MKPHARLLAGLAALSLFGAACGGAENDQAAATDAADTTNDPAAPITGPPTDSDDDDDEATATESTTTTTTNDFNDETATSTSTEATAEDSAAEATAAAPTVATTEAPAESSGSDGAEGRSRVSILEVSFLTETIVIRNDGAQAIDLSGYYVGNEPAYALLPEESLPSGATIELDVSAVEIQGDFGEIAIFSSDRFDSAQDLVAYVQWGSADNGRSAVAVEAGLIADGEYVENGGEDFTGG